MKASNCKYQKEQTITFQVTTGINKTNVDINAAEQISILSKEEHSNSGFEFGASVEGGMWPFSNISTKIDKQTETGVSSIVTKSNINLKTKLLNNAFDLSNSQIKQIKVLTEIDLPLQDISVHPGEDVSVTANLDEIDGEVILTLTQTIYNDITVEIILENNQKIIFTSLLIDLMKKLQQYDFLPEEIVINDHNNTIFFLAKQKKH